MARLISSDPYDLSHTILNGIVGVLITLVVVAFGVGVVASLGSVMEEKRAEYTAQQLDQMRAVKREQEARCAPVVTPPMVEMREKVEKVKPIVAEIRDLDALISQMQTLGVPTGEVFEYRTYLMDKLRATLAPPVLEQETAP